MTENQELTLRSAFLHDTQQADLCREQALLEGALFELVRSALERAPGAPSALPFRVAIPFCPIHPEVPSVLAPNGPKEARRIEILAPVARDGWIVRPVRLLAHSANQVNGRDMGAGDSGADLVFPAFTGYPRLPTGPAFVLGYGGNDAAALIRRAQDMGDGATGNLPAPFRDFSVRVWYHAEIRLDFTLDPAGCRTVAWRIGKPSWMKATK